MSQAALKIVIGLLVMLLQICLEGANAWVDQQTSIDLQILPGNSIICCIGLAKVPCCFWLLSKGIQGLSASTYWGPSLEAFAPGTPWEMSKLSFWKELFSAGLCPLGHGKP